MSTRENKEWWKLAGMLLLKVVLPLVAAVWMILEIIF